MKLGAGRIIDMDMTRIARRSRTAASRRTPSSRSALDLAAREKRPLHLLGLLSDGGVHSHQPHLDRDPARAARGAACAPSLHAFLDGRDTPPRSAPRLPRARSSRRSPRPTARSRPLLGPLLGDGPRQPLGARRSAPTTRSCSARASARAPRSAGRRGRATRRSETDEFVDADRRSPATPRIADGDAVPLLQLPRRPRARDHERAHSAKPERFAGSSSGEQVVEARPLRLPDRVRRGVRAARRVPPARCPTHILGEVLAARGLAQFRIAETEKYAHVTFFFNAAARRRSPARIALLVPSPRDVATYDQKPEMSAHEVTERAGAAASRDGDYAFVLVNFANPDMVGHTGVLAAAVKAVETSTTASGASLDGDARAGRRACSITADHGNCEQMIDPTTGEPHTAHTTNPVPIWWVTRRRAAAARCATAASPTWRRRCSSCSACRCRRR